MRGRLLVGGAVVLALALLGGVVWSRMSASSLETAVGKLPESVLRASYTDWAAVAEAVPGADLTEDSSEEEMAEWLAKAFEKDLTSASALDDSFPALASAFGITPLDADWEIYGQARDGSVDLLRLSDDVDLDALEERFADLGYEAPAGGAGSSGVWVGTPELVSGLDRPLTPVQENLAVVGSQRLLVMSDSPDYVETAVEAVSGDTATLEDADGVSDLVAAAGSPSAAVLWTGDFACEDLAMSQADTGDQAQAESLVSDVGGVHPLTGLVMALQADSTLTVAMEFASDDQASDDLQPRTDLASGPAPGQGGTFADRFEVSDAVRDGRTVTLTLTPVGGALLSDLGQGPVLFATC